MYPLPTCQPTNASILIAPGGIRARQHHPAPRRRSDASATRSRTILTGAGYTVTPIADPDEAFAKVAEHQLVDHRRRSTGEQDRPSSSAARSGPRRRWPRVPVLCVSQTDDVEERIRLPRGRRRRRHRASPFDARELEARVEALLLRFQRSTDARADRLGRRPDASRAPRRIVAVFSPKGGVGTTTIATNIARRRRAAAARPGRPGRPRPAVRRASRPSSTSSRSRPSPTSSATTPRARARAAARTYAIRHDSGLHVLCAPPTPEAAELVTPDARRAHPRDAARGLRPRRRRRRLDARRAHDARVFEAADTVVLPVYPEIPALKAMHCAARLPQRGRVDRREVDVRAQQHVRARDPEAARRRACPWHEDRRSTCRTTRSSTSRPSTRACRSSSARRLAAGGAAREAGGLGVRPGRIHAPARRARTPSPVRGPAPPQLSELVGRKRVSHAEAHPKPHPRRC